MRFPVVCVSYLFNIFKMNNSYPCSVMVVFNRFDVVFRCCYYFEISCIFEGTLCVLHKTDPHNIVQSHFKRTRIK